MNKKLTIASVLAGVVAVTVVGLAFAVPANAADGPTVTGQTSHSSNGIKYYDTQFSGGGHVVNPSETSITNAIKAQKAKDAAQDAAIKSKASGGTAGTPGKNGTDGKDGAPGVKGDKGDPGVGFTGAYYAVAKYDVGDTNGGAIATVACTNPTDVAISGGVQTLALGTNGIQNNVPVSSSFPGRMDWSTNAPKADNLNGWIVQFGTETGAAPKTVNIYALCVPGVDIPVTTTYTESVNG